MPDDPAPGHRYRMQNKATGKWLGMTSAGVHGDEWHVMPVDPPDYALHWEVQAADIGLRFSVSADGELRLDSNAERQVYFHAPNDSAYQKWRPIPDGEGYWQLINVATGFALDGNPTDIYTTAPNDGAYQRWGFLP